MRPSVVIEKNWSFSIDQGRAHRPKFMVHFINLSTVPLCRNRFARVQEAGMVSGWSRPQSTKQSPQNIFGAVLAWGNIWKLRHGPTIELNVVGCHKASSSHHTAQYVRETGRFHCAEEELMTLQNGFFFLVRAAPIYKAFLISLFALHCEWLLISQR